MARIYLASSWRNKFQPRLLQMLRDIGQDVYDFRNPAPGVPGFSWAQIDSNWRNWTPQEYIDALKHPIAIEGFRRDHEAMLAAEICVLLLPSGRSAHTEAGKMSGWGKEVHVLLMGALEPDLMYLEFDGLHVDVTSLIETLRTR